MNPGNDQLGLADRLQRESSPSRIPLQFGGRDWLFAVLLLVATLIAYSPALRGGLIWDDDAHITRPELRSAHGLYRIWFELGATQQYYPLLHSAFWIEYKFWNDNTLGYHLVNLSLHVAAALLVVLVLKRLAIPGAWLAAAIFALHPVQVESVAWITELKNTLSAVFYLGAMLSYLRFDRTRSTPWYGLALLLFVLGLLSKTVTATLPAALLVIFWWQRGRLSRKTDVVPLFPFFVLGAAAGLVTAWAERKLGGAEGEAFALTIVERALIAGRAIWFYLGKLFCPANLVFSYPRWQISQTIWWQYLFPLAAIALLSMLWLLTRRTRAPLAAFLFFVGTLFPVLGFLNVYPFIYSFVADHFQYLASLGIITLVSAGVALGLERLAGWGRIAGQTACLALLVVLAMLTWGQSRMYANIETLYRTTIARNPDCWMAHDNLGLVLSSRGLDDEAIAHYQEALRIHHNDTTAHNNWANLLQRQGLMDEAISHYQAALRINPNLAEDHYNWGIALESKRAFDQAITHYQAALRIDANYAEAHDNWGNALQSLGRHEEALPHYREALRINPNDSAAQLNWGTALAALGRADEAVPHFQAALRIKPKYAAAHNNWGNVLQSQGRFDEAIEQYQKALSLNPHHAEAQSNCGNVLQSLGRFDEAIEHYQAALRINPKDAISENNWGNALKSLGRFDEAVEHYRAALRIKPDLAAAHHNWGTTLVRQGKIAEAVEQFREALRLNPDLTSSRASLRAAEELLPTRKEDANP